MKNYIVASHGPMARALVESAEVILGKQDNVYSLCAYIDKNDVSDDIEALIKPLQQQGDVIVFTDLFGGSVNQIFMKYINENTHVFSGVNLPLLLTALLGKQMDTAALILQIQQEMAEMITYCNLEQNKEVKEEDF